MVAATNAQRARASIVGLALAPTSLTAVLQPVGGGVLKPWRIALVPPSTDGGDEWPVLTTAFQALMQEAGLVQATVAIALMPPFAEVRTLVLPPLSDADTRQLLVRNASKYFVSARTLQVVACAPRAARSGSTAPRVVAAAAGRLLQLVQDAARPAGVTVGTLVPAEAAWAAHSTSDALLVCDAQQAHLLFTNGPALGGVRRFRAVAEDAPRVAEAMTSHPGTLRVAGAESPLRAALSSTTATPLPLAGAGTSLASIASSAEAMAAAGAPLAVSLQLETDRTRAARATGAQRLAVRLALAAAACLALAGALQLWDVQRELAAVRAEREALRPQLGTTLVGRTTVETAFRQLAALSVQQRAAPMWSSVLADLSRQLPPESYLTGFRGRADTLGIDGLALSAARVFDAVERVPRLQEVRASSPVRRETTAEGIALERFQLSAVLRDAPAPATTTLGGGSR